jgi:hypothetical protein
MMGWKDCIDEFVRRYKYATILAVGVTNEC